MSTRVYPTPYGGCDICLGHLKCAGFQVALYLIIRGFLIFPLHLLDSANLIQTPLTARCLLTLTGAATLRTYGYNPALKPPARYRQLSSELGKFQALQTYTPAHHRRSRRDSLDRDPQRQAYMPRLPALQPERDTLHRLSAQRREALSVPWRKKNQNPRRPGTTSSLAFPFQAFSQTLEPQLAFLLKLHTHFSGLLEWRNSFSGPFQRFLFLHTTHPN
ncbi:Hypothetical_protein [Hexamita inflata]|uniref:Hypothetical_protein n=1 Tax=Hexamita inflata TaxID=28002 RepID=A0ABP1HTQ6_9EUKA